MRQRPPAQLELEALAAATTLLRMVAERTQQIAMLQSTAEAWRSQAAAAAPGSEARRNALLQWRVFLEVASALDEEEGRRSDATGGLLPGPSPSSS